MNDYDFDLFIDDLKKAVLRVHNDGASRVQTYVNCEGKEYLVIIEDNTEREIN